MTSESQLSRIASELPEIGLIKDGELQEKVAAVWAGLLRESSYETIGECTSAPGRPQYDLAGHTRQVTQLSIRAAESMQEFWSLECEMDVVVSSALLHDASKLVEWVADGTRTEVGKAIFHAQLTGVRCHDIGMPPKVTYIVSHHPFTPPHIHVKPQCIEFVIVAWADILAADTCSFALGQHTHLEIEKKFFRLG